jgi:hypothetical protein
VRAVARATSSFLIVRCSVISDDGSWGERMSPQKVP